MTSQYMIVEVCWDSLWTLSFGLTQFHGHNSLLVCEVALNDVFSVAYYLVLCNVVSYFTNKSQLGCLGIFKNMSNFTW